MSALRIRTARTNSARSISPDPSRSTFTNSAYLHPRPLLAGALIGMERGCQQNASLLTLWNSAYHPSRLTFLSEASTNRCPAAT